MLRQIFSLILRPDPQISWLRLEVIRILGLRVLGVCLCGQGAQTEACCKVALGWRGWVGPWDI